jgi:hypothetical protein
VPARARCSGARERSSKLTRRARRQEATQAPASTRGIHLAVRLACCSVGPPPRNCALWLKSPPTCSRGPCWSPPAVLTTTMMLAPAAAPPEAAAPVTRAIRPKAAAAGPAPRAKAVRPVRAVRPAEAGAWATVAVWPRAARVTRVRLGTPAKAVRAVRAKAAMKAAPRVSEVRAADNPRWPILAVASSFRKETSTWPPTSAFAQWRPVRAGSGKSPSLRTAI